WPAPRALRRGFARSQSWRAGSIVAHIILCAINRCPGGPEGGRLTPPEEPPPVLPVGGGSVRSADRVTTAPMTLWMLAMAPEGSDGLRPVPMPLAVPSRRLTAALAQPMYCRVLWPPPPSSRPVRLPLGVR